MRTRRRVSGGAGGLLEAVRDLIGPVVHERALLVERVLHAPLLEPGDCLRDPLVERRRRLPAEQLSCLAYVGDVVSHFAEQRRRVVDLRLDFELGGDQLGRADQRIALAVGEVDRLVCHPAAGEPLDAA